MTKEELTNLDDEIKENLCNAKEMCTECVDKIKSWDDPNYKDTISKLEEHVSSIKSIINLVYNE